MLKYYVMQSVIACGIICIKETVMDQKIIIEKINTVLTKVQTDKKTIRHCDKFPVAR